MTVLNDLSAAEVLTSGGPHYGVIKHRSVTAVVLQAALVEKRLAVVSGKSVAVWSSQW